MPLPSRKNINVKKKGGDFHSLDKLSPRKNAKIQITLEPKQLRLVQDKMKKHNIKSVQELFDCLIVSGFIWRNKDIIDYVKKQVEEERSKYIESRVNNFDKDVETKTKNWKYSPIKMYEEDRTSLLQCLVEMNIKQQWLYRILIYKGFALDEETFLLDFIQKIKKQQILERKKEIEKISKKIPVGRIPANDAKHLLKEFTQQYDRGEIGDLDSYSRYYIYMDKMIKSQKEQEKFIDDAFNKKMANLKKMSKLSNPIEE